jgi:subtilisin family serine protease
MKQERFLFALTGGLMVTTGVFLAAGCGSTRVTPGISNPSLVSRSQTTDPNFFDGPADRPGEFIVTLADTPPAGNDLGLSRGRLAISIPSIDGTASDLCTQYGGAVEKTFDGLRSFHAKNMTKDQAKAMSHDSRVQIVEVNCEVETDTEPDDGISRIVPGPYPSTVPWGLDRIDQDNLPLSQTALTTNATGEGVHVYVIDSGIEADHSTFEGRATRDWSYTGNTNDEHGHGTRVASIIGGKTFGIAKRARLHSVRVFNENNRSTQGVSIRWFRVSFKSSVLDGMNWVAENRQRPAVANFSGGTDSWHFRDQWIGWIARALVFPAYHKAVNKMIDRGVIFVTIAGNESSNSSTYAPGDMDNAIVVGASDKFDNMASFSNYGGKVDLFAPGVAVPSATWGVDNGVRTEKNLTTDNGTSYAGPHVTGVVALYLQSNPNASQAEVESWLKTAASRDNKITLSQDATNAGTTRRVLRIPAGL